jgi:FtsX extracellular domain
MLAAACESKGTEHRTSPRAVPIGVWVAGLCTAFGRFGNDLDSITYGDVSSTGALTDASFEETVQALRRLKIDVEALGIPDVEGGAQIATDVVAGVGRSLSAWEQGRELRLSGSESPGAIDAQAIRYPFTLLLILSTAGEPTKLAVYLDDPVRDTTIARLSRLFEQRPEVATMRFESKAQACRRFKKLFADQEALVENVDCDALPASFRVQLTPGTSGSSLHDVLIQVNGVDKVISHYAPQLLTEGDRNELDPIRAEAPRHTECTSLIVGTVP